MKIKRIIMAIGIIIALLAGGFAVYAFGNQNESGVSVPATDIEIYPTNDNEQAQKELEMALELRDAILRFDYVEDCLVSLRIGVDSPLVNSTGAPTASVVLTIKDSEMLSPQEVQSIAELVRSIIPDVINENIVITDNNLNYYQLSDDSVEDNH